MSEWRVDRLKRGNVLAVRPAFGQIGELRRPVGSIAILGPTLPTPLMNEDFWASDQHDVIVYRIE
jgi:hypothetical protein